LRRAGIRRSHLATLRKYVERNALAGFARRTPPRHGRILCYHSVGSRAWGVNDVSPQQFRRHIELARRLGYRFVPAAEIARTGGQPKDLAITFDDGSRSVALNAAPLLADLKIPWTMFVVTDWAEGRSWWEPDEMLRWGEIARLVDAGATIGSHSVSHQNFATMHPDVAREELFRSHRMIQDRLGITPAGFAIPYGRDRDWTPDARAAARDAGYEIVYAACGDRRPADTVARTFMTRADNDRVFGAALQGVFDQWEEWF
jgi:peptidoglycan/xylan/chitin deacetylase (PgdA/CDA1 family)